MKKLLLLVIFLFGCDKSTDLMEPDGCGPNPRFKTLETSALCMDSLRCVENNISTLSNFICFCDQLCLCFFSITNDCDLVNEECEKLSGVMTILPGNFCFSDGKYEVLQELHDKVKEIGDG